MFLPVGNDQDDPVGHDRSDNAALKGFDDGADLAVGLLCLQPASHRAFQPAVPDPAAKLEHFRIGVILRYFKQLFIILLILYIICQQKTGDKTVLHNRYHSFQLFLDLQLLRAFCAELVHLGHRLVKGLNNSLPGNRLHQVLFHAQGDRVLRVVKLVIS